MHNQIMKISKLRLKFRFFSIMTMSVLCMLISCASISGETEYTSKPNIILILSDDMGFSDLGCYGGEINTPHLDALAKDGIRYTEFYNTARCWTTRACLLTGLYAQQSFPLKGRHITLAEELRSNGYNTAMVGKWHLNKNNKDPNDPDSPMNRGFDNYYGTLIGANSFWHPPLTRNYKNLPMTKDGYYYTDEIGNEAVRQIKKMAPDKKPFFQYVAFTAAHWPIQAPEKTVQKYLSYYKDGWEKLRQARYARQLKMGIVDAKRWELPAPESNVKNWDTIDHKEWRIRNMAVYAAMLDHMDQAIGKIIKAVKDSGEFDNTLICFFNDNGACSEHLGGDAWGTAGSAMAYAKSVGKKLSVGDNFNIPSGGPLTYHSLGHNWANASNTPLRRYKANVHEGGACTPVIMHYPRGIKKTGIFVQHIGHVIDLMPTCLELAGVTHKKTFKNKTLIDLEGESLVPTFTGNSLKLRPIYLNHANTRGLRYGDWKVVSEVKRPWTLYHMKSNKTESKNLASKYPEKVKELVAMYDEINTRVTK
jgi:arylsulfatase A-like enzyme